MESDYQSEIARAMQGPGFYPHPVKFIKLQETHISRVLLTGDFVYKIKKIEFNERFRCDDIASDLAFLAMDLDFEGYPEVSGALLEVCSLHNGGRDVFILSDRISGFHARRG